MQRRTLAATALAGVAALVLSGCASPAGGEESTSASLAEGGVSTITAEGIGEVTGTPDVLTVGLGVETRGASANETLAANNEKAEALIRVLKDRGVADKDLQTSGLSIYPTYDDQGRRITGYQVNNSVTAKLRDLAGAGALIDAAAEAAGDAVRVNHLGFSIDDDSALRATARADAVRRARDQAEQMAQAAGVKLGKVRSISEASSSTPPQPFPYYAGDAAAAAPKAAAVPIAPGSQELTLRVVAIYEIG